MADYKGIQGYSVQKLATDPTASETKGQLWYNSTTGKFKISATGAGAWASGGTAPKGSPGTQGFGIQTAAVMAGGGTNHPTTPPDTMQATSLYDGNSWTAGNDLNEYRQYGAAAGTTTAGLIFAGSGGPPNPGILLGSEEFDGTNWTEGGDSNAGRNQTSGFGTQTAAILATGGAPGPTTLVEEYDGTSWTEVNNINAYRFASQGGGTTTAGIVGPGASPAVINVVEEYDGTCWAEVNSINTSRRSYGSSKAPAATWLIFAGPTSVATELYDGTSWTSVADCANQCQELSGAGSGTLGLKFGGTAPAGYTTTSEEWDGAPAAVKTVTVS